MTSLENAKRIAYEAAIRKQARECRCKLCMQALEAEKNEAVMRILACRVQSTVWKNKLEVM